MTYRIILRLRPDNTLEAHSPHLPIPFPRLTFRLFRDLGGVCLFMSLQKRTTPITEPSYNPSSAKVAHHTFTGTRLRARREQHHRTKPAPLTAPAQSSLLSGCAPVLASSEDAFETTGDGNDEETRCWKRVSARHRIAGCYCNGVWVEHTNYDQAPPAPRSALSPRFSFYRVPLFTHRVFVAFGN